MRFFGIIAAVNNACISMKKYHLTNRKDRELVSKEDILQILQDGKFATIAMARDNEPYVVTLSYGYDEVSETLFFHCATKGLKLDFLNANKKVCATVIEDGGYAVGECAHEYKSVVFWGDMEEVLDVEEKKHGMRILASHLEKEPSVAKKMQLKGEGVFAQMAILKLNVQEIHAKKGR